jgi:hypothetical protein
MNQLEIIEHQNQRVLTTAQLAEVFGTDVERIQVNFSRNKERYKEGKHFNLLQGEELKAFKASYQIDNQLKFAPSIYLWTEKGSWMHAKSLGTDEAWEAYEELVDDYYRAKSQLDVSNLSPELQMFKQLWDGLAQKEIEDSKRDQKIEQLQSGITTIKETIIQRDEDWRKAINSMFNKAVINSDTKDFQALRNESYKMLEDRARCDLNKRLRNLLDRLEENGATRTQINKTSKMNVIENDPRLKEIYTSIVKEISIRYVPLGV